MNDSWGSRSITARATVSPPSPESKMPMGPVSMGGTIPQPAGGQAQGGGQLAGAGEGGGRARLDAPVEQVRVEDRRHEALVEVAQPVDQVAVLRLGGHHLDRRVALAQEA